MILLIDNYDSFTFNLQRYLFQLGQSVVVARNDAAQLDECLSLCQAIVISPGPKAPDQAGRCLEIIRNVAPTKPLLGICLGHQAICQAFGGTIVRAPRPIHGRATAIRLVESPLFAGLPNPAWFARYHALVAEVDSLPAELEPIAWSDDHQIMAVAHRRYATFGVQFHPESILSTGGFQLLANFLSLAGLPCPTNLPPHDLQIDGHLERNGTGPAAERTVETTGIEHSVVLPSQRYLVELP